MRKLHILLAAIAAATTMMAQETKKSFTLDDLLSGGSTYWQLQPQYMFTTWWGDVAVELTVDKATTIKTPGVKTRTLFTTESLNDIIGHKAVHACTAVTLPYAGQPLVRVQTKQEILLVDFEKKNVAWRMTLPEGAEELTWSPDSRALAFCKGSDVYVITADGQERRITADGNDDIVYGHSVSRQEFGIMKGLFWNADGTKLAFYKKDQSRIPSYPQVDITKRIAATYVDKYPMAGCESEDVSVAIYDIAADKTVWLDNPKPKTDYMTNLSWAPDGNTLYIFELNRDQDLMQLFGYDATTGRKNATPLIEERHPKYVEPMHTLSFLPWDNTKAVMQSQRDNWNHLYLIDLKKTTNGTWRAESGGGEVMDNISTTLLTPGNYEVLELLGFNERDHSAIFKANATHPLRATLHKVKIQKNTQPVLISADDGVHHATISKSGTMVIDTYNSPTVSRRINIINTKNANTTQLLDAPDPWKDYNVPEVTLGTIKAADGTTDLYYRLIKPTDFDPSKKYPTVVYVYGGPHAHNVQASRYWGYRGWEIYMAQQGYVIFVLDNRGSEHRGLAFEQATFRHLGQEEMRDQMCGIEFLRQLPYVDSERIGVHGWSFGGFMTTNLMCTYPDVFRVGVAGGPVIDWKYYEVMYGERYMDTPEQNPEGYEACSLLPKAAQLRGRLQIIFGYNDPTCVPQHTLSFIRAAIDAGTQPDLFLYPGGEHNMFGTDQIHLHQRITRYFDDYLK